MPAASEVVIPIRAVDNTNKAFASVKKSLHSLQQSVFSVKSAVAGLTAAFSVGQMTKFLDTATRIENRLKLVTKSSEELVKAQEEVFRIAQITGSEFESVANLYSKVAASTESLNLKSADQVRITETISKAISISGASAASAAGAITQLGQALDSGTLRGEEFNSVNEQAPRIMKALADSLGVSRGKLRELAKEGLLTSEIVTEALLIQSETIDKEYGKTSLTVSAGFTKLENAAVKFFNVLDENAGLSDLFGEALARMARGLDKVTESMKGPTKIELKKQIEDLTKAQQKELIELDALVMGNNSLNIMQQNQARILRLNIAERGKHIKELRAEYDELVNGKKATEDSSTATNENTESTKKSSEASKKLEERLAALRAKLNEKTESTKKATKSVADLSLEFEHAYTMGNVTALTYQGVKEANAALAAETIALSTAMEEAYTMGNVTALTYQGVKEINEELRKATEELRKADEELKKANEELLESTIDLSVAMEHNYTMGNVTALTYQGVKEINEELKKANEELKKASEELKKANEELLKSTIDLSTAMEHNYTMGNVTALTYQGVKEINEELRKANEELKKADEELRKANEKLLKSTIDLSVAMEHNYTMGNLNVDAFAAVRDINKEIADSLRETTDSMREATNSMIELSLAMEHNYTMGNLNVEAFKEMKKAAATAFPKQLAQNQYFQGITAAGGAAGARAMTVTKAFAESPEKGVFALVMSNKKVQEALEKVFTAIFALIDPIIDLLAPVIETLVTVLDALKPLFQRLVPIIAKLIEPLMKLVNPLLILIDITIMQVEAIERLIKPLEELWEPMNKLTKVFETGAQRLIDALVQLPQRIADAIREQLPDFSESLQIGGGQGLIPDNVPVLGVFKNGGMIPKAQNGMLVGGSHSMGGTMVAAEGGEYIFSREAVQRLGAGRLNQLNNGQDDGGVVVNIYDGTGQRISAYDSALRVEIKERAARNSQFAAVA